MSSLERCPYFRGSFVHISVTRIVVVYRARPHSCYGINRRKIAMGMAKEAKPLSLNRLGQ